MVLKPIAYHHFAFLVAFSAAIGVGCGSSNTPVPARSLTSLAVQPPTTEATAPTGTSPFIALGTFNQAPLTDDVTAQWSSSDTGVATIDAATGLATCIAVGGPVTITATASQKQAAAQLTCVAAPQAGSGNCAYQCPSTRCPALTGYCSISTGNACRQAYDSVQCPIGMPAGRTATDSCGVGIDTTRACSQ